MDTARAETTPIYGVSNDCRKNFPDIIEDQHTTPRQDRVKSPTSDPTRFQCPIDLLLQAVYARRPNAAPVIAI